MSLDHDEWSGSSTSSCLPFHTVFEAIKYESLVGSVASSAACVLLIILYRTLPRVRRTPGWLQLRATICEAMLSATFIALFGLAEAGDAAKGKWLMDLNTLSVLLVVLVALEAAAHAWRLLVYIDLVTIYRNPFYPDRNRFYYLPFVIFVSGCVVLGTVLGAHLGRSGAAENESVLTLIA